MYDVTKIQECFKSIIGWRNSTDSDVPQITDADLLATDSGRYYNDFHPLINIEDISNSVSLSNTLTPEANIEKYLKEKVNSAVVTIMSKLSLIKKEMRSAKTLLNSSVMFDGIAPFGATILNESKFVGFRFVMKYSYGVSVKIDRIALQFTSPQTNLPIRLFHSSQEDPLQTVLGTTTKSNSMQYITLSQPIDMSYYGQEYDSGGYFYLGYYQDDALGQALQKTNFDWVNFCAGCKGRNAMKVWNTRLNFLEVRPMYVAAGNFTFLKMFDSDDAVLTDSNNYGMNFATTITCDLSEYFCENKILFTEAIGRQAALFILEDMKHSNRINRNVEVDRNMIIRDLEGDNETNANGLYYELEDHLKALDFDFSMIDSPCLPESIKYGIEIDVA